MKKFPSKLLLFGEYTVLEGGQALAVPLPDYEGHWSFGLPEEDRSLMPFLRFLQEQGLGSTLDLKRFEQELSAGLFFESSIPVGYGLGSSGALCAGVYHRFARNRIQVTDSSRQDELRQELADLERFFHGSSSGADPLICYLQQPLLLGGGRAEQASPKVPGAATHQFFLVDTKKARRTAPLVERFAEACQEERFQQMVLQDWVPLSEKAIGQYLRGEREELFDTMKLLSALQYEWLQPWIPEPLRASWYEGLRTQQYYLKLCGAGGGGFLLGYGKAGDSQLLGAGSPVVVLQKI